MIIDWVDDPEKLPFLALILVLGGLCMIIKWGVDF
jgi:hypothetical protein